MKLSVTRPQYDFIFSEADETLFGGAAGGGKSYAQLIDALLYALAHGGSHQLILRRTLPELERSLIRVSLGLYPQAVGNYQASYHRWRFINGSEIEFGCCDAESDVTRYQSAEYDVIRFDELTHFTRYQFTYLLSRIRGANDFPKRVKSTTNPGGVGHDWVKKRYIDRLTPGEPADCGGSTRLFVPARVQDNCFLMKKDASYLKRLEQLDENSRRALLEGDWNLSAGRYFPEFSREIHVCAPFPIPEDWERVLAIDYGLDMLAALWIARDALGNTVVYREVYEPGLIVSDAAARICAAEAAGEPISRRFAPPDLWGRRQETGRSAVDIFAEHGLYFEKSDNRRVPGWLAVKEYLRVFPGADGRETARLRIFEGCTNLIRTLGALQCDSRNPNDAANHPHELTHASDALRGYCATAGECGELPRAAGYDEDMDAFLGY
ncbi:MAG: phage terminase large subunit [Intestinibacillus sp.]